MSITSTRNPISDILAAIENQEKGTGKLSVTWDDIETAISEATASEEFKLERGVLLDQVANLKQQADSPESYLAYLSKLSTTEKPFEQIQKGLEANR